MDIFTRTALINERWDLVAEAEDIYVGTRRASVETIGEPELTTAPDRRTHGLLENFARQDQITVLLARY